MQIDTNPNQIKYPFNGRSKYLIDKFCIIGFDSSYIQNLVEENRIKENIDKKIGEVGSNIIDKDKNSNLISIDIKSSSPMLISEISSDYMKEIISSDIIKELIFPKGCQFFYEIKVKNIEEHNNSNKDLSSILGTYKKNKLAPYFVIFSNNPQIENNSKKSINCFSYIFYNSEEISLDNGKILYFYAPISFNIISEFPFFNNYYTLCRQIYNLFNEYIEIPLEVILYNIINFTPSPLNYSVTLDLNSFIDSSESSRIISLSQKNLRLSLDDVNKKTNTKNFNEDLLNNRSMTKKLSIKNNKNQKVFLWTEGNNIFQEIKFEILSGYPLIQYNLLKVLLYKLSPEDVIIIFFYTFLERNVLFFSNDIELLSLTINSYINLNFPLNDEKYYFNGVSISLENYKRGNSNFSGTAFTSILGINSEYREDYVSSNAKLGHHLTVDLDNGVINMLYQDRNSVCSKESDKEDIEEVVIFKFFKKIFRNKELKENEKNTILYKEVKNIFDFLTDLKRRTNDKNDKLKKIFEMNYIDYYDTNNTNDKKLQYLIKTHNYKIQEAFYSLVNNLCIYFYENFSFSNPNTSQDNNEKEKIEAMDFIFNDNFIENSDYVKEEISFLNELRDTMKFQSFVYSFIKSYNPIDLYKIPLTFTEEFLSVLSSKSDIYKKNKNKINFLALIDLIYIKKDKAEYKLDFYDFCEQYNSSYKKYIDNELLRISDNDKIKLTLKESIDRSISVSSIRYLNIELDNAIIYTYKYIIDNIEKNEKNLILNYINKVNENNLENMKMNLIEDSIEKNLMELNLITANDICFSNIIILFIISMKNLKFKNDSHIFITSLFRHAKIFRNYYRMLMEVICILLMDSIKNENYEEAGNYIMIYFYYINSLRSLRLIPNENLYRYIKKFESIATDNFNKIVELENSNNKEIEIDDEELNYVYISRNFTPLRTIEEEEVIQYKNKLLNNELKTVLDEAVILKVFNPRITFNNKKLKLDFLIISQIDVFTKLKNSYNTYILNGLDITKLNLPNLLGICANILIYFKYMEDFNEKEEVNNILIEIYNVYLDLYIEKRNSEKKKKNNT